MLWNAAHQPLQVLGCLTSLCLGKAASSTPDSTDYPDLVALQSPGCQAGQQRRTDDCQPPQAWTLQRRQLRADGVAARCSA